MEHKYTINPPRCQPEWPANDNEAETVQRGGGKWLGYSLMAMLGVIVVSLFYAMLGVIL